MKLLTVTVPAYNMERLLPKCLGSCLCPGAEEELEVIVVNDGSTDGTLSVARGYEARYPEIFRVIDKKNGGHGSGINAGMAAATGRYFKVLDADDWFAPDALAALLGVLRQTDAELVTTGFCCVNASTMKQQKLRSAVVGKPMADGLYPFAKVADDLLVRMHSVTWRTDVLRENGIRIDEGRFYVDMQYISLPIPYVNSVYVTSLPLYMYRLGENGQSVSIASMQKHMDDHLSVMDGVLGFIDRQRELGLRGPALRYLERVAAEMATNQCLIYLSFPASAGMKQQMLALDERLEKDYPGVYKAMRNKAVVLLRKTKYALFPAASAAARLTRK